MADHNDLARELVALAQDDRAAAEALLDLAVSDTIVCFHAQQAVEKALKAALAAAGASFPRTHNIGLLLQLCEDSGAAPPPDLAEADLLTPYAVAGRYGTRAGATLDRQTALRFAAGAVDWATPLTTD